MISRYRGTLAVRCYRCCCPSPLPLASASQKTRRAMHPAAASASFLSTDAPPPHAAPPSALAAAAVAHNSASGDHHLNSFSSSSPPFPMAPFARLLLGHINGALLNNAKYCHFTSPLWMSENDVFANRIALKSGASPTQVELPEPFQYYNLDAVTSILQHDTRVNVALLRQENPATPTNMATRKSYQGSIQIAMREFAAMHNFTSNWWLTEGLLRKMGWLAAITAQRRSQRGKIGGAIFPSMSYCITSQRKMFNLDQLEGGEWIRHCPRMVPRLWACGPADEQELRRRCAALGAKHGIFVPLHWATAHRLRLKSNVVSHDNTPLDVGGVRLRAKHLIYNIDDVTNGDELCESFGRFPTDVDTFVIPGTLLTLPMKFVANSINDAASAPPPAAAAPHQQQPQQHQHPEYSSTGANAAVVASMMDSHPSEATSGMPTAADSHVASMAPTAIDTPSPRDAFTSRYWITQPQLRAVGDPRYQLVDGARGVLYGESESEDVVHHVDEYEEPNRVLQMAAADWLASHKARYN